jgi:hypothetical protein
MKQNKLLLESDEVDCSGVTPMKASDIKFFKTYFKKLKEEKNINTKIGPKQTLKKLKLNS